MDKPVRDPSRIVLPPSSFVHEHEKVNKRWPAAVGVHPRAPAERGLRGRVRRQSGLILQGGLYNSGDPRPRAPGPGGQLRQHPHPPVCAQRHLPAGG
ncbi:MAG: hypothetical protein U5L11_12685 [Arhodomonas sp.]|nr:hypothetical protein [Arhodomonas sp.]